MAINNRTISIRTKRLAKTNMVKIIKSNGCCYIEAIPSEYCDDLSVDELNKVYLSFIKLGRELYHENKEKNISKIEVINGTLNQDIYGTLLRNNPNDYINDEEFEEIAQQFDSMLDIKYSLNCFNHSFVILKDNNKVSNAKKLKQWFLDNYIPIKEQSNEKYSEKKYWVHSDDGMMIDMAIFCYLVTYSIINIRKKFIGGIIKEDDPDFIQFKDFINFNNNNYDHKLYIELVNDIIYHYEIKNIHSLYGFNKLQYDYDKEEYKIVRQYEDIYGVLWHIFKLYLAENYKINEDNNAKYIPITICEECGSPILGDVLRCDDCKYKNQNVRQKKCREEKFAHIEEIRKLINTESFPNYLIKKANKYIKMTNYDIYNCKKTDIDNLLKQLKSHKEKVSKH